MQQEIPLDTTRRLARYIANVQYEDIPPEHYEALKKNIVDITGAIIAGHNADGIEQMLGLIDGWGGKEEARILFRGKRCVSHWAAFINSAMGRGVDCEDNEENGAHPSASMWPTVLACADKLGGISGKDMLLGYALGRDIGARVNFSNLDYHGFEPVNTAGVFATTAIACRLFGLTEDQTISALGHAMNFAGGSFQSNIDGVLGVRVNQGMASFNGILAAELAQAAVTGPYNAFEGVYGYFHLFANDKVLPEILLDGLGTKFLGERINFKRWPSCGQTSAATDLALQLVDEGLDYNDIESIHVRQSPSGYNLAGKDFEAGPNISVSTQFCAAYCIANALVRKHPTLDQFNDRETALHPEVVRLCKRITTAPDPSFLEMEVEVDPSDPLGPVLKNRGKYLRVEFDITLKDGTAYTKALDFWKGYSQNPLSLDEIIEKYRDSVKFVPGAISAENSEKLLNDILHLEDIGNLDDLMGYTLDTLTK